FQTNITEISPVEKKNLITENLIELCTEPLIDNATLNKKSSDIISFYCTACDDDIQDIINARNSMKRASEAMAIKYKISTRRVYQIWRENHPPIDPREIVSQPINIGSISSSKKA
ncbi:4871_t:CDS:2, partial [Diversispora eburnea]